MATVTPHTTRAVGTVLTASIYNADHVNHVANSNALNADLIATPGSPGSPGYPEIASPATPALGFVKLYAKADGNLYQKDDAGLENILVGLGASGSVEEKTGPYTIVPADDGKTLVLNGYFTLTLPAAATLGSRFNVDIIVIGTRRPTILPDGAETVDGLSPLYVFPGWSFRLCCSGTTFYTKGRVPRFRLNAAATFFVSPAGTATDDGLAIGSPKSLSAMQSFVRTYLDQGGNAVQVQMADGTYPPFAQMAAHWHGHHNLEYIGNAANQNAVVIAPSTAGAIGAYVSDFARVIFRYMRFEGHVLSNSIVVEQFGVVGVDTVTFASCNAAVRSSIKGNFKTNGVITLAGVHGISFQATDGGMIEIGSSVHVVNAGYSCTYGAVASGAGATVFMDPGASFAGAGFPGAGKKFLAQLNGVIGSGGGGPNVYPGTSAGDQLSGGRYQ